MENSAIIVLMYTYSIDIMCVTLHTPVAMVLHVYMNNYVLAFDWYKHDKVYFTVCGQLASY